MKKIKLDLVTHRGGQVMLIQFSRDEELVNAVRKISNIRWSKTQRSWYVPYSRESALQVKTHFGQIAFIDALLLKQKLTGFKQKEKSDDFVQHHQDKEKAYLQWMRSRRYSDNTIRTYADALKIFLLFFHPKKANEITNEDVICFNNEYILKNNFSSSYQNQVVSSIRLFFRAIENRSLIIESIHRPKRERKLPNVLSKQEVKLILDAASNLKHKAMLSLIYACGLRCGELLRLRPEDVDVRRGVLIIRQAKGKKDRIAPLSPKIIELLTSYRKSCPTLVYLFEGQVAGNAYDERSLQNVLKQNVAKAGIRKPVSLHWLRHSYTTHLLENGTDLRYIQEILGHRSSKTTEIYTHVSTKSIQGIVSPFDYL